MIYLYRTFLADDASKQSISNDSSYGEETKAGRDRETDPDATAAKHHSQAPQLPSLCLKEEKHFTISFKEVPKEISFCVCISLSSKDLQKGNC